MAEVTFPPKAAVLFDRSLRFIVLKGGRGSAKSWSVARAALILGAQEPLRFLCCRETMISLAESMLRLLSDQVDALGLGAFYEVQRDRIIGKNGTLFTFVGLTDTQRVKSTEGVDICIVEEAQSVTEDSLKELIPTIRKPGSQIWVVYNPRYETDAVHQKFVVNEPPPGTVVVTMNYSDNPYFPEVLIPEMEHMRVTNPLLYTHVWEGECVPNLANALWTWDSIDKHRLPLTSDLQLARVLVGVDPAVTANKNSDETGIIVVGCSKGTPRHFYVLSDQSGRYSPEGWARQALDAYDAYDADAMVFEVNQGGALVTDTVRNVCRMSGRPIPRLIEVRASRGKVVRAEPIAALYSQGLVHHVGPLPDLERQLLRFNPIPSENKGQKSPDRMDALVWALTQLSEGRAPMRIAAAVAERLSVLR